MAPCRQRVVALSLLAMLLCSVVIGCSSDVASPGAQSPLTTDGSAATAQGSEPVIDSPLQEFRLTPTEIATVTFARGMLIDGCMRRFGLAHPQRVYMDELASTVAAERESLSRLYGLSDARAAAAHGYGFAPTPTEPAASPSRRSTRYRTVLLGYPRPTVGQDPIPRGGCAGEADRKLGLTERVSVYGRAHSLWIENQMALPRTKAYPKVIDDWVACMAERGHTVTDPLADQGDIARVYAARQARGDEALAGEPVPGETALAADDVACKQSARLVERLNKVSADLDGIAVYRNSRMLHRDRERLDRQVAIALSVIDGRAQISEISHEQRSQTPSHRD